ncbi:MAG TPA: hypothetical protein VGF56_17390 [Rhizomicrobium sp.]|jgi:hypothetical protein
MKIHLAIALACALFSTSALAAYRVGDRVAMPAGFGDKWMDAVVIKVDPSSPYPYRVHPLGYLDTMDQSFSETMLKARGAIATMPVGGIRNDPWLLKATGAKAFHPAGLMTGKYECWHGTEASMALNFEVLDAHRYRDSGGMAGSYDFNAGSGALVFHGGGLNGVQARYEQASNPPTKSQPPTVTLKVSGDTCQHPV